MITTICEDLTVNDSAKTHEVKDDNLFSIIAFVLLTNKQFPVIIVLYSEYNSMIVFKYTYEIEGFNTL